MLPPHQWLSTSGVPDHHWSCGRSPTRTRRALRSPSASRSGTPSPGLSARSRTPPLGAALSRSRRSSPPLARRVLVGSTTFWVAPQRLVVLPSCRLSFGPLITYVACTLYLTIYTRNYSKRQCISTSL